MPEQETIKKIEDILIPILLEYRLELIDIEFHPIGKRWLLRIYIDKEGGVTIADCETVSRELGRILDVEDFIEYVYTLEVSSPGITRPLKKMEDFEKNKGKLCKIITKEQLYGKNDFEGEIIKTYEDKVEIKGNIDVFTIPIYAIKKAHLQFHF